MVTRSAALRRGRGDCTPAPQRQRAPSAPRTAPRGSCACGSTRIQACKKLTEETCKRRQRQKETQPKGGGGKSDLAELHEDVDDLEEVPRLQLLLRRASLEEVVVQAPLPLRQPRSSTAQ
eukprot:1586116-Rhodomonas_salina.1